MNTNIKSHLRRHPFSKFIIQKLSGSRYFCALVFALCEPSSLAASDVQPSAVYFRFGAHAERRTKRKIVKYAPAVTWKDDPNPTRLYPLTHLEPDGHNHFLQVYASKYRYKQLTWSDDLLWSAYTNRTVVSTCLRDRHHHLVYMHIRKLSRNCDMLIKTRDSAWFSMHSPPIQLHEYAHRDYETLQSGRIVPLSSTLLWTPILWKETLRWSALLPSLTFLPL